MPAERRVPSRLAGLLVSMALLATALLTLPSGAWGQGSPFAPLPPAQTATPTATTPTVRSTTTGGASSVGSKTIYIAAIGAIALLAAIGWFIARDARRVAPVPERTPGATSGRDIEKQRARARARAKAARQQRKKNR